MTPTEEVQRNSEVSRDQVGGDFRFPRDQPRVRALSFPVSGRRDAARQLEQRFPDRYLAVVNAGSTDNTSTDVGSGDPFISAPRSRTSRRQAAQLDFQLLGRRRPEQAWPSSMSETPTTRSQTTNSATGSSRCRRLVQNSADRGRSTEASPTRR